TQHAAHAELHSSSASSAAGASSDAWASVPSAAGWSADDWRGRGPSTRTLLASSSTPTISCVLDSKDIQFLRDEDDDIVELGRGAFGTVYAGTWHGEPVALKKVRLHAELIANGSFWREVELHIRANHKHVVRVFGAAVKSVRSEREMMECTVVMERMTSDLDKLLYSDAPPGSRAARLQAELQSTHARMLVLLEVARGLRYLHARGIVHADLKPGNVMLDAKGTAQLTDFGLSVHRAAAGAPADADGGASAQSQGGARGTPLYMDPALLREGGAISSASDVYSWGVLAWELIARQQPYAQGMDAAAATMSGFMHAVVGGARPAASLDALTEVPLRLRAAVV
ncbi:hypothetical protein EON68_04875, partial [archaeon]